VEEDFKAINEYEILVTALDQERIKYKQMLEEEKTNIIQNIKDIIEQFDENVSNLFKKKLNYDSAIDHECLKMIRLSKMLSDNDERKKQIKRHRYAKNCFIYINLI